MYSRAFSQISSFSQARRSAAFSNQFSMIHDLRFMCGNEELFLFTKCFGQNFFTRINETLNL